MSAIYGLVECWLSFGKCMLRNSYAQECRKLRSWTRVKAGWVALLFCRTWGGSF